MSLPSICSGYRYANQRPFLMYQKPLQFSWFSTALKNIKETNDDTKYEKEIEESRTIATEKEADLTEESQRGSCSSELPNTRITKDEGPIRQSLLGLVMDEDVPELMEAMAEKLEFVFEDLTPSVSNAGEGILRNSAKRSHTRRRDARLEFHSSSPTVFTYPDEESAVEKAQWDEGKQITFTVYRELCEGKKEHSVDENDKHQSLLRPSQMASDTELSFVRTATLMEEPSMAESLLGVTGRISYNSAPIDLARFNKNTV
ncbi:hypothetical protein LOAG_00607 [Loa loa]|uniref:Protein aurora borealis n=1 Tax=Loa loa TaxID=7209 RepID=A0A1I7VQ96_LOALO|nr:hypothetical protein LOAG_00607 [Loa loa]EFO27864.1 hypothetical protein LOAG_00607 [Loa loa]